MRRLTRVVYSLLFLCIALAATLPQPVFAGELLVLPAVTYRGDAPQIAGRRTDRVQPSLDLLYALRYRQVRFFSEFVASDDSSELARLHLGWEFKNGATFWLGRFQTNQGYWNKEFHFRNYIQNSILAPGIAAFEREGGLLPAHFIGAAFRQRWVLKRGAAVRVEAGYGAGERYDGRRLESSNPFDTGDRNPSASIRLALTPDLDSDNELGIFYADNNVKMKRTLFSRNSQKVSGFYLNHSYKRLHLIGAYYRVDDTLKMPESEKRHDRFYSAYLQGEYRVDNVWMPYLRVEKSDGNNADPYVSLFPGSVRKRALAGLRWDFPVRHALKLEYADTRFLNENSHEWLAQWSLIFP